MKTKFTLIELIAVIVILGILLTMIIPNINSIQEDSKFVATKSNIKNVQTAVDNYYLKNNYYPVEKQPTLGNPSMINWKVLEPKYVRKKPNEVNEIYYWIDSFGEVWASDVDSPKDLQLQGQYDVTWTHIKGTKKYEIGYVNQTNNVGSVINTTYRWVGEKVPSSEDEVLLTFNSPIDLTDKIVIIKSTSKVGFIGVPTSIEYKGVVTSLDSPPAGEKENILNDTDGDGYKEIWYLEQLDYIRNDLGSNYELMRDLDFQNDNDYLNITNKNLWTTGEGWNPIGEVGNTYYYGNFEGNNYALSNLYVNRPTRRGTGVFSQSGNTNFPAHFKNLIIDNATVIGSYYQGALSGYFYNGTIDNVIVKNSKISGSVYRVGVGGIVGNGRATINNSAVISTTLKGSVVGGLIGGMDASSLYRTINQSYVEDVTIITNRDNTSAAGGLVGSASGIGVDIKNSYVMANISNGNEVGGLVGRMHGKINNSYFVGTLTGDYVGGIGGSINTYTPTITSTYWDIDVSSVYTTVLDLGTGLHTDEMKNKGSYLNWDFENIWTINPSKNNGYPYLKIFEDSIN